MSGDIECQRHWELSRELQREIAVLRTQVETMVDLRAGMASMDARQRSLEAQISGLSARITIALAILVPVAAGVAASLLRIS